MSTPDGGRRADKQGHRKRKQNDGEKKDGANKRAKKGWQNDGGKKDGRDVLNVEQLGWKGVSLENDEFDDFEELEGIDVDYVDVNGSKIVQFKASHLFVPDIDRIRDWVTNRVNQHRNRRNTPKSRTTKRRKRTKAKRRKSTKLATKNGLESQVLPKSKTTQKLPPRKMKASRPTPIPSPISSNCKKKSTSLLGPQCRSQP
jgi:hypothetical protein